MVRFFWILLFVSILFDYTNSITSCDETTDIECRRLLTSLLHKDLHRLQFPSTCSVSSSSPASSGEEKPKFLVFQYSKETIVNGFGAMFQFYATALAIAHSLNRTLIEALPPIPSSLLSSVHSIQPLFQNHNKNNNQQQSTMDSPIKLTKEEYNQRLKDIYLYIQQNQYHDPWLRAPLSACGGRKHTCYFEPSSSCVYTGNAIHTIPELDPLGSYQDNLPIVKIDDIMKYHDLSILATRGSLTPTWYQMIICNTKFIQQQRLRYSRTMNNIHDQYYNQTDYWSTAILSCRSPLYFTAIESFLFRPKASILSMVTPSINAIKNTSLSIGVHVRRGDAVKLSWRSKATPNDYVKHARKIRKHIEKRYSIFDGSLILNATLSPFYSQHTQPVLYIASDSISSGTWISINVTQDNSFRPLISPASLIYQTAINETNLYYTSEGLIEEKFMMNNQSLLTSSDNLYITELNNQTLFKNLDPLIKDRAKLIDANTHIESYILDNLQIDTKIIDKIHHLWSIPVPVPIPNTTTTTISSSSSNNPKIQTTIPDTIENNYHIEFYNDKNYELIENYILNFNTLVYTFLDQHYPTRVTTTTSSSLFTNDELQIYSALTTYIYISNAIKELTEGVIMDIYSLSHTQYIIGTCLSQVSRISSEIQYNYGYNQYPPIGLDTGLCRERSLHPYSIQMNWQHEFDTWIDD